jgi:hypothetical protein
MDAVLFPALLQRLKTDSISSLALTIRAVFQAVG